jgi:hypothetical protein
VLDLLARRAGLAGPPGVGPHGAFRAKADRDSELHQLSRLRIERPGLVRRPAQGLVRPMDGREAGAEGLERPRQRAHVLLLSSDRQDLPAGHVDET